MIDMVDKMSNGVAVVAIKHIKYNIEKAREKDDSIDVFGCDRQALDMAIKALVQQSRTGHWSRKTKVDAYDIAGVKTWGIKCQCDRCDFTTIVVEDFGYYTYCPNCGTKMEVDGCIKVQ